MKIIKEVSKEEFKDFLYYELDAKDDRIYEEARDPNKLGIFQMNAGTASYMIEKIQPKNFDELNACSAFARPGTMDFADQYVENRDYKKSPYPDKVQDILSETNQVILYQEQVMKVFNVIGGFTLEETNEVRGLMKKLGKLDKDPEDVKKWEKVLKKFTKGAVENGITETEAQNLAEDLLKMSGYSFNKCFSGDCKIDRDNAARWHPTIEEMYLTKNSHKWAKENNHIPLYKKYRREGYGYAFSIGEDNRLYKNKIVDIFFSGKRGVYKISLKNGKNIEVTSNHSFPVYTNEDFCYMSIDTGLKIGSLLVSNEGYEKTEFKSRYNFTNETNEIREYTKNIKTKFVEVVSIEKIGEKNTYDVEMESPYHTLSVNGIVAKNSHSSSYTYIAVMTLYLSVYFRKYFYSAVLEYEIDRDKYLVDRLNGIRQHGFKIIPPDINKSKQVITPGENNEIIFGLSDIKNVGMNAADKIVEEQPFTDFFDYVMRTRSRQVTSTTTKNLIKIGAFDNLIGGERKKYLQAFTKFWESRGTSKVKEKLELKWKESLRVTDNIPFIQTKSSDLIEYEKDVLGFNFFNSPFTEKRVKVIEELHRKGIVYYDFDEVGPVSRKISVSINDFRIIKDKNGNEMAFIEMDDINGRKENVPVFASYWKVIGNKLIASKGKIILVNVYRDDRGSFLFGQKSFVSDSVKILRMVKEMP